MRKEQYERTELDIIRFRIEDVIMTSVTDDDYEGWNPHNPASGSSSEYEGWNPH